MSDDVVIHVRISLAKSDSVTLRLRLGGREGEARVLLRSRPIEEMEGFATYGSGIETDESFSATSKVAGAAATKFFSHRECLAVLARQLFEGFLTSDYMCPERIGALATLCRINRTCASMFRSHLYDSLELCPNRPHGHPKVCSRRAGLLRRTLYQMNSSLAYHTMVLFACFDNYRSLQCDLDRLPMIRQAVLGCLVQNEPSEATNSRLRLPGLLQILEWDGRIPDDLAVTLVPCRLLSGLLLKNLTNSAVVESVFHRVGWQLTSLALAQAPHEALTHPLDGCLANYLETDARKLQELKICASLLTHEVIRKLPSTLRILEVVDRYEVGSQDCCVIHLAYCFGFEGFLPRVTEMPQVITALWWRMNDNENYVMRTCDAGTDCKFLTHRTYGLFPFEPLTTQAFKAARHGIDAGRIEQAWGLNADDAVSRACAA